MLQRQNLQYIDNIYGRTHLKQTIFETQIILRVQQQNPRDSLPKHIFSHMTTNNDDRYVFVVQWYDSAASLVRTYNLTYYLKDKTIEMFDLKSRKMFLKKTEYPNLQLKDIFIGAVLNVYSRQLKVIDYADEFTRAKFQSQKSKTFAMIKPDCYMNAGKIINMIEQNGFTIGNIKMAKFSQQDAEKFYQQHRGKPFYKGLVEFMTSDLVVGMELISDNCVKKWRDLLGPTDVQKARQEAPNSIRALFGEGGVKNAAHGSDSSASAARELQFFFSNKSNIQTPAIFNQCSCLVIKPHVVSEGYIGQIVDAVLASGFEVSALEMFWLDRPSTQQFLEVYKNVVQEYNSLVEELTNGPCVALEIRQENVVPKLRQLCGPHDPEMARNVRPKSLRAVYGKDKGKNAVHCTDLPEDGILEVQYFFNILQKK